MKKDKFMKLLDGCEEPNIGFDLVYNVCIFERDKGETEHIIGQGYADYQQATRWLVEWWDGKERDENIKFIVDNIIALVDPQKIEVIEIRSKEDIFPTIMCLIKSSEEEDENFVDIILDVKTKLLDERNIMAEILHINLDEDDKIDYETLYADYPIKRS